ncbi:MAG: thioredoxin domain-containing protein [Candidatus ainarchaeum sp.]|nr:thioredoxin domain-containing protein [Candidatus ainarchaeum sp.]
MAIVCIIALIAFSIMGIFSAKYRAYAKEAFRCFINTIQLRKCDSGLDEKIKAEIVSKILPISAPAAKAVNRHFELLSSIFIILMLASSVYSTISLYNFFVYGNCNGQEGGFCILKDLTGGIVTGTPAGLGSPKSTDGQAFGNANYKLAIYEFGCYSCPYTAQAEPIVQQLYSEYGNRVEFIYKTFPLPDHPYSNEAALASWCAYDQGTEQYMLFRKNLFAFQSEWRTRGNQSITSIANSSGLNMSAFSSCFSSAKYQSRIDKFVQEGKEIGIYGTPTFFIGSKRFVGAVTYDELKGAIEEELKK